MDCRESGYFLFSALQNPISHRSLGKKGLTEGFLKICGKWENTFCEEKYVCPVGTSDNNPAIHGWERPTLKY